MSAGAVAARLGELESAMPLPPRARAHAMLALLMLVAIFAYADMQLFSLLATDVKAAFGLSDASIGVLQGLAVSFSTALALIPVGVLVDKVSRVRLLMVTAALWSLFTLLTGLADGFWQLFACRVGVGIAEAAVYPAAYSLLADLYAPVRRPFAVSVFLTGTLAGASIATALSGTLIGSIDHATAIHAGGIWDQPGWRLTFAAAAVPGLLCFVALALSREPARRGEATETAGDGHGFLAFLSEQRALVGRLLGTIVLSQVGLGPIFSWLPSTFTRMFGFSAGQAGEWFGAIFGIGSLSGIAVGTMLVSVFNRRGDALAPLTVFKVGVTLTAVVVLLLPFARSPLLLAAAATGLIASVYVAMSVTPTLLMIVAPGHLRGRLIALETLALYASMALTPLIVGLLSDRVFAGSHGLLLGISTIVVPCNLLAPLALWRIRPLLERLQMRDATV